MKVWLFVNTFFTILYYLIFVFIVILFKNFIDHDHLSYRKRSFEMRQYYCSLFLRDVLISLVAEKLLFFSSLDKCYWGSNSWGYAILVKFHKMKQGGMFLRSIFWCLFLKIWVHSSPVQLSKGEPKFLTSSSSLEKVSIQWSFIKLFPEYITHCIPRFPFVFMLPMQIFR